MEQIDTETFLADPVVVTESVSRLPVLFAAGDRGARVHPGA